MSYVDVDSDKGGDHFARPKFRIEQRQIRAELAHLLHVHRAQPGAGARRERRVGARVKVEPARQLAPVLA